MGTFDYICRWCGSKFEHTAVKAGDNPLCPNCGCSDLVKLFPLVRGIGVGLESADIMSDRYMRPDKKPNPARMWKKFGKLCADLEMEGKTPKVDDNIELSVKAWENAGYEA